MDSRDFEMMLRGAVKGRKEDLEKVIELYGPLIDRYSYVDGRLDEDLRQYLMMRIVQQIGHFSL